VSFFFQVVEAEPKNGPVEMRFTSFGPTAPQFKLPADDEPNTKQSRTFAAQGKPPFCAGTATARFDMAHEKVVVVAAAASDFSIADPPLKVPTGKR